MAQQVASAPSPRFEGPAGGEPPLRRSHRRDIYGALDLGTNNCRLLIARPSDGGFTVLELPSRKEAVAWAARIAKACRCDQELRVFQFDPQS